MKETHKIKALSGSVLIYGAFIALLFLLPGFSYVKEIPLEEEGVMVSLGEPDNGGESLAAGDPAPSDPSNAASGGDEEQPITQDIEESVDMKNNPSRSESPSPSQNDLPKIDLPAKESQRVIDSRYQLKKTTQTGGGGQDQTGDGKGDGKNPGMEGQPDGVEGGNPDGTGSGTSGFGSWKLAGRKPATFPRVQDNLNVSGTVVVKILVNQEGKVIEAIGNQKGTTISDARAIRRAEQIAKSQTWSPKADAPEVQEGEVRIKFNSR